MGPSQVRFVTACQQLLVLGVVIAALTPAAAVVSLEVISGDGTAPTTTRKAPAAATLSAYAREAGRSSVLPSGPVKSSVREFQLTAPADAKIAPGTLATRGKVGSLGQTAIVSTPERVPGYGAIGVTWAPGEEVGEDDLVFEARTRTDGVWSDWIDVPYHDDHGADPDSREARRARPGTDVLLIGRVDDVQVRANGKKAAPADMRLAVVAPGHAQQTVSERAAIVTDADGIAQDGEEAPQEPAPTEEDGEALDLQASAYTPQPVIYSRKQWGANERLRDKSSLTYYEVHAGFVHHTVNANDYSRREVPGIIRSIYAYHTQSRGWSDVGYNFLVDKFGRIWEGRAGGIDRPVVGAHTLGYNEYSFAMSAIGNFETVRPRDAMLQAYGALFAWKLSLHGVDASSTAQKVGSDTFPAINGHRDAGQTACPGRYLYRKLPKIREYAAAAQKGWSGRELDSDLASTAHPDLIVRRASDGKAFILPTGGLLGFRKARVTSDLWDGADAVVGSPDLTGDGIGDLLVRAEDNGSAKVHPGTDSGFGEGIKPTPDFAGRDLITAVGDLDDDGANDLVARNPETGRLNAYFGGGAGGFTRKVLPGDWSAYDALAATGDLDGDGNVDLVARDGASLWLVPGTGTRDQLGDAVQVPGRWGGYDQISGFGDFSRDGRPDLVVRRADGPGWVLPSRGDGTFGHRLGPIERLRGVGAFSGGGDLTGTGAPDLVGRRGDNVLAFPHTGRFDLGTPIATGVSLATANLVISPGDWDRDGHGDMLYRRTSDGALMLRRGDGAGRFTAAVELATGFGNVRLLAGVGDMTGDGYPDLMGQPRGGSMRLYPGKGLQGLKTSYVAYRAIDGARQLGIGRWDSDGSPDTLVRQDNRLTLFKGNGPGGLTSPQRLDLDLSRYDWVLGVSDLNLRGHADVIVRSRTSGRFFALRATAQGFLARRYLGEGEGYDLAG